MVNQIFEAVSDLFAKKNTKIGWHPVYSIVFACISFHSVDKMIAHCCFSIDKIEYKKCIGHGSFLDKLLKIYIYIFFWPYTKITYLFILSISEGEDDVQQEVSHNTMLGYQGNILQKIHVQQGLI